MSTVKARAAPTPSRSAAPAPDWSALLAKAVTTPGVISEAYSAFWKYSVGNQILAIIECALREIEPGPINTFMGWKQLGRSVRRGEKAITLCMPVTCKRKRDDDVHAVAVGDRAERATQVAAFTRFIYRPHWFVLSQTEGKDYVPAELPEWSESLALENLRVERVPFRHSDGNAQGYAVDRQVAVSPIAFMPHRTLLHELAHVELGHTEELGRLDDDDVTTPRDLREVEAECVAMICCCSLKLGGQEFSRGYVQHWLKGQSIPDRSAQRIFKAADQILKAGIRESADLAAD